MGRGQRGLRYGDCTKIRVKPVTASASVGAGWYATMTAMGTPRWVQQVEAVKLRGSMAIADEIAAHCAHKACYGEEYPPKNCAYNKMPRRRTPLSSHVHIPPVRLPP